MGEHKEFGQEIVEIYRQPDRREVVEVYSRPLPGYRMEREAVPVQRRNRKKGILAKIWGLGCILPVEILNDIHNR